MKVPMVAMIVSVGCSGRVHRGLDGDPWPGVRSARSRQARSTAEDGDKPAFLSSARNAASSRQGKKVSAAVAGRRSRLLPALGPDQPIRGCVGRALERSDGNNMTAGAGAAQGHRGISRTLADDCVSTAGKTYPARTLALPKIFTAAGSKARRGSPPDSNLDTVVTP